jgi:hypothetical protein
MTIVTVLGGDVAAPACSPVPWPMGSPAHPAAARTTAAATAAWRTV